MNSQKQPLQSVPEDKDSRLKYVEIPTIFRDKASQVDLHCKTSQKSCERLAKAVSKARPKTPEEFEKVEALKEFILRTSDNNTATLELLTYMKGLLQDILVDHKYFIEGAILRDKLKFQSDTIEAGWAVREEMIKNIVETKRHELRSNS